MRSLVRKNIAALAPYSTARDEYQGEPLEVYLDANENPYDNGVNRYPDPYQKELKAKLSEIKGVAVENIFVGNGSDEAIDLAFRVFCEPNIDNVVSIVPTYGMYKVAAEINGVEVREVPLDESFELDVDALLAACDDNTKLLFLCSPNNPSGNLLNVEDVETILERFQGIVVLDEAYIDFAPGASFLPKLEKYPRLVVLQTLSKAWGMAGLRLGLAFASQPIIELFTRVKYPYNINVVTQAMVLERLNNNSVNDQLAEIIEQREWVISEFAELPIIKDIYKSDANFVLVEVDDPKAIYDILIEGGVIVRDRSKVLGCEGCLRITIGTPDENEKLVNILKNIE